MFIPLFLLPSIKDKQISEKRVDIKFKTLIKKYPFLLQLLIGISFLFISHTIISTFITQIVFSVGGNNQNVGTALMISGFGELPAMFFFSQLIKIKKVKFWVNLSAAFFLIRSIIIIFCSTVGLVQATQLFQAVGFALFIPASAYLFNSIMSNEDNVFGQTLIVSSITLGGVFGTVLGGILIDSLGIFALLVFGSITAALGFLFIVRGLRKVH